ncbi:MAG: sigma-70 family RNA polymerase sigma factor [Pirellulales bacterium]
MTAVSEEPRTQLADLVREHQAGVWRYLRYLGAGPPEADDLTQETFLAVARAPFEERCPKQTAAYLRTVAGNQLRMLRRRQKREGDCVSLEAAEAVWAEAAGDDGLETYLDALRECLAGLDGRAKQAIDLHYRENVSREEISERLEIQPEGVKTLLRRTRQVLRECIERCVRIELTQDTNQVNHSVTESTEQ